MAQQIRTSAEVGSAAASIADPAPLGLFGFALTTFVLSVMNAGIISAVAFTPIVIGLAVFYGGTAQLLAGMWEFRRGNTFGATAFPSYGAFWLSFAAILIPGFAVVANLGKNPNPAVGLYLLGWAIFTALMTLGAIRINGALSAVFVLLTLTYIALTIGMLTTSTLPAAFSNVFTHIGGWLGIATAIAAWYTALAGVLKTVGGAPQLPVFPMAR
ncbi:MAG TPA: acetate uptake transporter [Ktedonobacterales bacterium]|jgi:hypothetical protein